MRFFCLTTDGGREAWCFCLLIVGEQTSWKPDYIYIYNLYIIINLYVVDIYVQLKDCDHIFFTG